MLWNVSSHHNQAISTLCRYGFDRPESTEAAREALRCLANAFLLHEPSRQTFVDLGYGPKAAERLKLDDYEDEFLISRIFFFLTYNTTLDFEALMSQNDLAQSINQIFSHHAEYYSGSDIIQSPKFTQQQLAMSETLKLLFNITYHYPDSLPKFDPAVESLVTIVLRHPLPEPPLQPPTSYLLNALLNLDIRAVGKGTLSGHGPKASAASESPDLEPLVNRLIHILDAAVCNHPEETLDQAAASLFTLLRRLYELATPRTKAVMRTQILPNAQDRDQPLGKGGSLSSRLLRLSCSPKLPTLGGNISALLFEMSEKDPGKFVQNIGYGYASGFLMSQNIEVPPSALEANASSNGENVAHVNPVTGQRWAAEERDASSTLPMTEEEKEREAERLFVLFERLKATGVVNVQNPVERRFEEID